MHFLILQAGSDHCTYGNRYSLIEGRMLHISDFLIGFYDINGAAVATEVATPLTGIILDQPTSIITHRNTAFPDGRNFQVTIASADIPDNATTDAAIARYMTAVLPGTVTAADVTAAAAAGVTPDTLVASVGKFQARRSSGCAPRRKSTVIRY